MVNPPAPRHLSLVLGCGAFHLSGVACPLMMMRVLGLENSDAPSSNTSVGPHTGVHCTTHCTSLFSGIILSLSLDPYLSLLLGTFP